MLYLAQVHKQASSKPAGFQLLAVRESEETWAILPGEWIPSEKAEGWGQNLLVLVEASGNKEVISVQDAKPWVLEVVQRYLAYGFTPELILQERDRAEQWRQSLTLQSQELDRRALELEARREQIQALEEDLQREKKRLETLVEEGADPHNQA